LWIVRDVKTRAVPFFMVRSARSGVHVLVILAASMEELAGKYFKRVDEIVYDGGSIYNAFTWLNVNHKRVTFGKRDYAEQGFRSVKHRLSLMDKHFPWNSNAKTIERWFATYFLIYNILYYLVYLLDKGVIINVNISNE
jgi:transposase-like protein